MADIVHNPAAIDGDFLNPPGAERADRVRRPRWLKSRCKWLLVGALGLLPPRWTPLLFPLMARAAGMLPPRLRQRVGHVIAGSWALSTGIRQHYRAWIRQYERVDQGARRLAELRIADFADPPLISVVMPVFNPNPEDLRAAIQSVERQFYPHWELCIADDASTDPRVRAVLREAAVRDKRIRVVWRPANGHIAAASNSALELANGAFVALLDHDDILAPHALYEVASRVEAMPSLDILFSDEDKIDRYGRRYDPYFKPGWNPELMRGQNLISHLGVFRLSLLRRIGGFRTGLEGSQDYDLALRAIAQTSTDRIAHIPMVLYHWRQRGQAQSFSESALATCVINGRRAVQEQVSLDVPGSRVVAAPSAPMFNRVLYPVPQNEPLVSVVIPTRNRAGSLRRCMQGLLEQTEYRALDVLIVDNGSDEPEALRLLEQLEADPRVRVLWAPGPSNVSAANNRAAAMANGSLLLLLSSEVSIIHPGWMREMVSHAIRPDIGAVGAKLLYPDNRIQHAGMLLGMGGVAGHQYLFWPRDDAGYYGHLALARNVSAVTSACLMVRLSIFQEVGGLNERDLPIAFNDVDFCLRVQQCGYRNVWTPFAELYCHETVPRGSGHCGEKAMRFRREADYMQRCWGEHLRTDPYWNPNLALNAPAAVLAFPPRFPQPAARAAA